MCPSESIVHCSFLFQRSSWADVVLWVRKLNFSISLLVSFVPHTVLDLDLASLPEMSGLVSQFLKLFLKMQYPHSPLLSLQTISRQNVHTQDRVWHPSVTEKMVHFSRIKGEPSISRPEPCEALITLCFIIRVTLLKNSSL